MTDVQALQEIYQLLMVGLLFITASSGILTGWFISGRG